MVIIENISSNIASSNGRQTADECVCILLCSFDLLCSCDLVLDLMTFIQELDPDNLKAYLHYKYGIPRSMLSKFRAKTGQTQTHRHD